MQWRSFRMTAASLTTSATVSACLESNLSVIDAINPVWSNFEIGDLDFWRGEAYTKCMGSPSFSSVDTNAISIDFEFLDKTGGFYYEVCLTNSGDENCMRTHLFPTAVG
jgi:hypothetical protein